jgi:hypothetical protein
MMDKSGKLDATQPKTLFFKLTGPAGAWKLMTQDFSAFLSHVQSQGSFSNLCPAVHGLITTQHSLLAAICDPKWVVMMITPEGLNLIQDTMTDLGMEYSVVATGATKQYWMDKLNFPNPVKLKMMLTQNPFILTICRDIHSYLRIERQSMCSIWSIIRWLNPWFNVRANPSLHGLQLVLHPICQICQSLLKATHMYIGTVNMHMISEVRPI